MHVGAIVMPLSRQDFVNWTEVVTCLVASIIGLKSSSWIAQSIQELHSDDDSVTDDILILVSQKFEEDKGLCLENDNKNNKTDEIPYKKQNRRIAVQMMSRFSLHRKTLKKTKDGIWRITTRTMKSMKVCKKHGKVSVAAIVM